MSSATTTSDSVTAAMEITTALPLQTTSLITSAPLPDPTASLWYIRTRRALLEGATAGVPPLPQVSVLALEGANAPSQSDTLGVYAGQPSPPAQFDVLQKWEGIVLGLNKTTFRARLIDLVANRPDQEAEIYVEEVSPRDRSRLVPGALFYWYVGYRDDASGDRERASKIRLRRLPPLGEADLRLAHETGERLRRSLGWHR